MSIVTLGLGDPYGMIMLGLGDAAADPEIDEFYGSSGDDDGPERPFVGRKRTQADFDREYNQLLARVPPDLRPVEKVMRRLGAKPLRSVTAPVKGKDLAGAPLVGPIATNVAMQQMREEEAIMLLMLA